MRISPVEGFFLEGFPWSWAHPLIVGIGPLKMGKDYGNYYHNVCLLNLMLYHENVSCKSIKIWTSFWISFLKNEYSM